ncbi:MAG: hypothetical protein NTW50_05015 [Candidatus Berkelbacteria bacterium]|nr:hypothetical protein [Candidatus Berkelbacteria bacterium]
METQNTILNLLKEKKSIFLIGSTNADKSWFAEKNLLLFLQGNGLTGSYITCAELTSDFQPVDDFIIIDEVESLQDRKFLENLHSD